MVLAEDFSKIPGFFDCVPQCDKEVSIHYLYRNEYHTAVYDEGEPIILPQADHRSDEDWKTMEFDWPCEIAAVAEGAGSANVGVD
jgi:hypothetical protein